MVFPSIAALMTLLVRLFTLLTIAAAGFALPMTCATGGTAVAAELVHIEIPAAQQLEAPGAGALHLSEAQNAAATLANRAFDQAPFDCGKTAPRATDQPATFDSQPSVPGYLGANLFVDEERTQSFGSPGALIPIESRAGPPDAPPPKSID